MTPPTVLTIAGSDSGAGAGIQADLKTFAARGVYGASVLTAVTAQNTLGVQAILELPAAFVGEQIDAVLADIGADAVKTGMLASAPIIATVVEKLAEHGVSVLVADPVMVAKGGDPLLAADARDALIGLLLPRALVVTPNLHEAGVLIGGELQTQADMREAARAIHALGAANVVVKGGHVVQVDESVDILFDGTSFHEYHAPRIRTIHTHGTGCTFASAIAAELAKGASVPEAVGTAKRYITGAIRAGADWRIGGGHGPVDHFWEGGAVRRPSATS
jgi:hydroxymethylpyrimidine/phosphomethylpyrimidine kinase